MSRSYKKNPICKDHNKYMKKYANRRFRKRKFDIILKNKQYRKYTCSYDICDYIFRTDFKEYIKIENNLNKIFNKPLKSEKELYKEWYKFYKRK